MIVKEQLLAEIQHRMNNQYDVSRYIAEQIYDALGLKNNLTIDISKFDCNIESVNIIIKEGLLKNTSGSITDLKPVEITIRIYKLWDCLSKEWLITDIQNTVSHELMHADIFSNTYNTYKDCGDINFIRNKLNTQPIWYQNIMQAMKQLDNEDDIYKFMYAMYTCYYHEKQAFVAQSDTQIKKLLFNTKIERISYTNVAKILERIDNYNIFIQNIEICEKLKNLGPLQQVSFMNEFNEYLIEQNRFKYRELVKLIDYCYKASLSAIRLIENILVTDFYEINDKLEKN